MPLYDFECSRGHVFDKQLKIADRDEEVRCEFEIEVREISLEQLADSLEQADAAAAVVATLAPAPGEAREAEVLEAGEAIPLPLAGPVTKMACGLKAKRIISHADPKALLSRGLCANRDAALEGRWDPDKPITRGVRR